MQLGQKEDSAAQLRPGLNADLVILERDPLEMDMASLPEAKLTATYKDGHLIYSRGQE
ncbi:MAG: amidohydrolase family protein [Mycobacterium sp.]